MESGRISGGQLICMMFWAIMGTAVLSLPILISIHAPRSAWMAAVIFTLGGILLCLIMGGLVKRFPGEDFVSYVEKIYGKWLGKSIVGVFFVWLFHTTTIVIWQITSFTQVSLLPNTPYLAIVILFMLPSVYAVYGGLESIARASQFIFMISFTVIFLLFFMHIPEMNVENVLPLFDEGMYNILRSSLAPLAWAGEIMFVLFLVPYVKEQRKISRYSIITILLIGIGGFINEFFYTAVFGALRTHLSNPFYTLVRYIRPTAFFERYDILFVSINLTGNFIKLSVFLYILVFCGAQIIGAKSHRPLVLPISIGLIIFNYYAVSSTVEIVDFLDTVFVFYTIPLLYGFPALTLLVAIIRRKSEKST